ncbi:MAG TPA: terminase small subunit [Sphingomonas sp.]
MQQQPTVFCDEDDDGGSVADTGAPRMVAVEAVKDHLTPLQRAFCEAFVANGGKSADAARTAGYGGGAENMGLRNLAKKRVQDEIERRVKTQRGSALAMALGRLLKIIETSQDDKAAVQAALGLMDRMGMAPPRGPGTTVNVNTMTANAAQSILIEVANARQQRLMSGIDDTMTDTTTQRIEPPSVGTVVEG